MVKLYTPLSRDELDQLRDLAREERRRPQEQAAHLIAEALKQRKVMIEPRQLLDALTVQDSEAVSPPLPGGPRWGPQWRPQVDELVEMKFEGQAAIVRVILPDDRYMVELVPMARTHQPGQRIQADPDEFVECSFNDLDPR